jgi:UMF1 family MFS transporter
MIIAIIVIQFLGIAGAHFFARLSKKIGNISTLKITIVIWLLVSLSAYFLEKDDPDVQIKFYLISVFLGLVLGAIQTLSRSTFSKLLPEDTEDHATYFSLFGFTEKIAIVWGTFIFGIAVSLTGSMKLSILLLSVFFLAGLIVLSFMKKTKYVK